MIEGVSQSVGTHSSYSLYDVIISDSINITPSRLTLRNSKPSADDGSDVFGDPILLLLRLSYTKQVTMMTYFLIPRTAASILVLLLLSLTAGAASAVERDAVDATEILLEDFSNPLHVWKEMNDPIMGGRSTGTFSIEEDRGVGVFTGAVKDVPFLQAPGFIQVRTIDKIVWPDVTLCQALELELRTNDNDPYAGYRVSFGTTHAPGGKFYAKGYKATLQNVPNGGDFEKIQIPFRDFTDFWDDATGDPIHTCQENALYCPDLLTLKDLKTMALWGEGVKGKVSLEIKAIRAVGCAESAN
jgi:hypothetical protein